MHADSGLHIFLAYKTNIFLWIKLDLPKSKQTWSEPFFFLLPFSALHFPYNYLLPPLSIGSSFKDFLPFPTIKQVLVSCVQTMKTEVCKNPCFLLWLERYHCTCIHRWSRSQLPDIFRLLHILCDLFDTWMRKKKKCGSRELKHYQNPQIISLKCKSWLNAS